MQCRWEVLVSGLPVFPLPPAQHVSLTGFLCRIFHPSSFSSKKHMKAKTLRRFNLSPGQRVSHRPTAGMLEKRQVLCDTWERLLPWIITSLHGQGCQKTKIHSPGGLTGKFTSNSQMGLETSAVMLQFRIWSSSFNAKLQQSIHFVF